MGQTMERMKEGYSKIRNEALAHAFAYMNLIEHWGSGIPRIIDKVKAAGLQEPEFIGGGKLMGKMKLPEVSCEERDV